MISHLRGAWGEDKASEYLIEQKYRIVKRNFRKAVGEVDIIAVRDNKIVFFEVKTWKSAYWEDLHFSINKAKIHKLQILAEIFFQENPEYGDYEVGFDLILLSWRMEELNHIENII